MLSAPRCSIASSSDRQRDDERVTGPLKQAWLESGGIYGYRKLTLDMRDLGEHCGKHRVARRLKAKGLRSQSGYGRRPGVRGGKPAVVAPNHLQQQFTVHRTTANGRHGPPKRPRADGYWTSGAIEIGQRKNQRPAHLRKPLIYKRKIGGP